MAFTNLVKKINEKAVTACMRDGKAHTKQELSVCLPPSTSIYLNRYMILPKK